MRSANKSELVFFSQQNLERNNYFGSCGVKTEADSNLLELPSVFLYHKTKLLSSLPYFAIFVPYLKFPYDV